jgi:DNA-binding FadR family transcriptional regulator
MDAPGGRADRATLVERTVERIRNDARKSGAAYLSPLPELSKHYGVSQGTLLKALHILRDEGVLTFSQGKRIAVTKRVGEHPDESSVERFAARLRSRIVNGVLQSGMRLPKVTYFVITEGLSQTTVCSALKRLEQQRLIHKHGRQWIVGPHPAPPGSDPVAMPRWSSNPVVLLLLSDALNWRNLTVEHLRPFATSLCGEFARFHIQLHPVLETKERSGHHPFVSGRKEILSLINSLGERYSGTVYPSHPHDAPAAMEWIHWLCQFKKPVVWFDPGHARVEREVDRRAIPRPNYYRCCFRNESTLALALERLSDLGHRTVAYPVCHRYAGRAWFNLRMQLVQRLGANLNPPVSVSLAAQDEPFWLNDIEKEADGSYRYVGDGIVAGVLDAMSDELAQELRAARGPRSEHRLRKRLLERTPSLGSLVSRRDITAILAPNQLLAVNYYHWLTYVGVQVPRDMSLVAYDNHVTYHPYPISAIDFGFDHLGYSAAHLLIGDLPVKADRWGNIANRPAFVDRGSLGPPATA